MSWRAGIRFSTEVRRFLYSTGYRPALPLTPKPNNKEYHEFLLLGQDDQGVKLTTHLLLASGSRMELYLNCAKTFVIWCLINLAQENFTFIFYFLEERRKERKKKIRL
jgi:hypothetical protein